MGDQEEDGYALGESANFEESPYELEATVYLNTGSPMVVGTSRSVVDEEFKDAAAANDDGLLNLGSFVMDDGPESFNNTASSKPQTAGGGKRKKKTSESWTDKEKQEWVTENLKIKYPLPPEFNLSTIDEMKVQTMYKMVQEITVSIDGRDIKKKVLYLTNRQASMFTSDELINGMIKALDIGEPKFVINLLSSSGVMCYMKKANAHLENTTYTEFLGTRFSSSEICDQDEVNVETQLLLFMKMCLLPLAKATRALILLGGTNGCALNSALGSAVLAEQARLGPACPYTVIDSIDMPSIYYMATNNKKSVAYQVKQACANMAERMEIFTNVIKYSQKDAVMRQRGFELERCDLAKAAVRYIIFEGLEFGEHERDPISTKLQTTASSTFVNKMLSYICADLPSIAIQTHVCDSDMEFLSDITHRGIPVLLLDCTERAITLTDKPNKILTRLAVESDAFPLVSKESINKIVVEDSYLTLESRHTLLEIALEMLEKKWTVFINEGFTDNLDTSTFAFLHSVLHLASGTLSMRSKAQRKQSTGNFIPLYEKIEEVERANAESKIEREEVPRELVLRTISYMQFKHPLFAVKAQLAKAKKWLEKEIKYTNEDESEFDLIGRKEVLKKNSDTGKVLDPPEDLLPGLIENCEACIEGCNEILAVENGAILSENVKFLDWLSHMELDDPTLKSMPTVQRSELLCTFDVLTHDNTYSHSVFDIDGLTRKLNQIARLERIPEGDSVEALRIIQDGWDYIELFHSFARFYKIVAKIVYIFMLLTGAAITVIVTEPITDADSTRIIIMALSVGATIAVTFMQYVNPVAKWQEFRMAAIKIESNIWLYRTRVGPYRITNWSLIKPPEQWLTENIRAIKKTIYESANIKMTSFYSVFRASNTHGQHAPDDKRVGLVDAGNKRKQIHPKEDENKGGASESVAITVADDPKKLPLSRILDESSRKQVSKLSAKSDEEVLVLDPSFPHTGKRMPQSEAIQNSFSLLEEGVPLTEVIGQLNSLSYKGSRPTEDTQYSPLLPDEYIKFRSSKMLAFYKKRIPPCVTFRNRMQTLLVLGAAGSGVLAFFRLFQHAPIITIFAGAITAYLEFHSTDSKIQRYSGAVNSFENIHAWWQALPLTERAAMSSVEKLIVSCEDLMIRDNQSWKSEVSDGAKGGDSGKGDDGKKE